MDTTELDRVIGDAHRAFIDSSSCIAYHSTLERTYPVAQHLFDRIANVDDPLVGYISVVSVAEMLVRPIRAGNARLTAMHRFLRDFPNLRIVDTDFEIAQQAANIRAVARLALPDSLLIGTALLSGCEVIVTNDERWSRRLAPLYPQFRWIYLGD